ncbi:MAG: N-acetylmuramoyl-L-alanine amidase [Prevotella sp.]|nr:N-acetylmuramoyl-L-alanine amidase [Prevotella sp.]
MAKKLVLILMALVLASSISQGAEKTFTLVIDAGHGGHDAGAKGSYSLEKNINLSVALAFGQLVEKNCPDVNVIYTRKTDVFIPLHERATIANKNKADVFISIHTNAVPAGRIARGLETYTMGMRRSDEKLSAAKRENSVIMIEENYQEHYEGYDPKSPESTIMFEFMHDKNMEQSIELAKYVQKYVCASAGREDKGVKQDVFLVLRETSMPACLIELGFITTPDEENFLNNKSNVDKLAYGIYQAFQEYKKNHTLTSSSSSSKSSKKSSSKKTTQTETVSQESPTSSQTTKQTSKQETENTTKEKTSIGSSKEDKTLTDSPVFKIQILAVSKEIPQGSSQFKGLGNIESYTENGFIKYTYGASTNYNEIYRLRKSILDSFPESFIVAFKNGEKMDVNQAISEFKSSKK